MKKFRKTMLFLAGLVLLFCMVPQNAKASAVVQEQTVEDSSSEEELPAELQQLLQENTEAPEPNREKPQVPRTDYTGEQFFNQVTLHGIYSSTELYFFIPEYWDTDYVYAELEYTASQLIRGVASSMTFLVNNVPVSSCNVTYEDGADQIVYVEIPMELLKTGYNSFSVSAYARLYDENGCVDDFTNANWLSISDASCIRSGYSIKDSEHKISWYPYPFMSTADETGSGLTIAVSDKATNQEIAAAMNLMADLSTETSGKNEIQFALFSDVKKLRPDRTILVSGYDNLPEMYRSRIDTSIDLQEKAVVLFTEDASGKPLLLITSKNQDCLMEAAYMLMDEERVSQEKSDQAIVDLGSAAVAVNTTKQSQMVTGNYTLGEIVGGGLSFVGPFHQEKLVYLPFTEDYFLSDSGKVTLNFRYSENLDFNRSLISVYWGNIPIASKKLQKDRASGDELTFTMPADVVGTTAGAIRITFDLEIPDMICTPRQDQVPWAYVSDQSVLYLPASTGIVLTFDLKPSPFRTDGKFNDLMLVISDDPTTEELNLYAQVVGMYGDGVAPYGTFYVKRAGEFSSRDADYNIITAGTYHGNRLIRDLNEYLHFQYTEDGNRFESNEQLILSDNYAGNIAVLQLMESPYAQNRGILAITGVTNETLTTVEKFMRDETKRYTLTKDCVIIDPDMEIKTYRFIESMSDLEDPTLVGTLAQNKQSILFTLVATSVMLMLLVAVIIILIRVRMYHKQREEE